MTQRAGMRCESRGRGVYVSICLIHFIVQQKPTQHHKEIILQKKKKKSKAWEVGRMRWMVEGKTLEGSLRQASELRSRGRLWKTEKAKTAAE